MVGDEALIGWKKMKRMHYVTTIFCQYFLRSQVVALSFWLWLWLPCQYVWECCSLCNKVWNYTLNRQQKYCEGNWKPVTQAASHLLLARVNQAIELLTQNSHVLAYKKDQMFALQFTSLARNHMVTSFQRRKWPQIKWNTSKDTYVWLSISCPLFHGVVSVYITVQSG